MKFEKINHHDDFRALLRREVSCFDAVVRRGINDLGGEHKSHCKGKRGVHD